MAVVSLALFKKHVRADDFADDDEYLQHLLDTAESAVITATNRTQEELAQMGNGHDVPTPQPVRERLFWDVSHRAEPLSRLHLSPSKGIFFFILKF